MNERIKELALQAKLGPALLLHYYRTIHALTDTEQEELEQIEKFAELIVQECSRVAKLTEADDGDDYKSGRTWAGIEVMKHFGVEE